MVANPEINNSIRIEMDGKVMKEFVLKTTGEQASKAINKHDEQKGLRTTTASGARAELAVEARAGGGSDVVWTTSGTTHRYCASVRLRAAIVR